MKRGANILIIIAFIAFVVFNYGVYTNLEKLGGAKPSTEVTDALMYQLFAFITIVFMFLILLIRKVIRNIKHQSAETVSIEKAEDEVIDTTEADEEESRANASEQLSVFMAQLKHNPDVDLNKELLKTVAEPFNACHGVIYEAHDETKLVASCTFANAVDKEITKIVSIDEGLIGQAVKSKKTTLLDDIPEGYINIVSGLGQSSPTTLIIMPLFKGDELLGVIEIASYKTIDVGLKTLANLIPEIISDKL